MSILIIVPMGREEEEGEGAQRPGEEKSLRSKSADRASAKAGKISKRNSNVKTRTLENRKGCGTPSYISSSVSALLATRPMSPELKIHLAWVTGLSSSSGFCLALCEVGTLRVSMYL
jgi:hypothetical protein